MSMQDSMLRLVDHTAAAQRVTKIEANIHVQPFLQNYYAQKTYADNFTSNGTLPIHSNVPSTFNVDVNVMPSQHPSVLRTSIYNSRLKPQ
jgi:hypothetical protein